MIIAPYRDDLNKIVILNPKGGCGKTTLATNLASYFALRGPPPALIDNDPKGYTVRWLEKRPRNSCEIHGVANYNLSNHATRTWQLRIPNETSTVIIDTPAALGRQEINELTYDADCILIPVLPSAIDIRMQPISSPTSCSSLSLTGRSPSSQTARDKTPTASPSSWGS